MQRLRWQAHTEIPSRRIPPTIRCWLLDPASLTKRIQQSCRQPFRVEVRAQGWQRPRQDEAQMLSMRPGTVGLVREVRLYCGEQPWVFARTVIPVTTLTGRQRQLARLGNRPLGAYLFADPGMRRGVVELVCIKQGGALFATAVQGLDPQPDAIWGRRSVFRLGGKPLLVNEIFLPTIGPCVETTLLGPPP